MIEGVNTLQSPGSYQNRVMNEFPRLFRGVGKMKSVYKIRIEDHTKTFSVNIPDRTPPPMRQKMEEELKRMEEDDITAPVKNPTK